MPGKSLPAKPRVLVFCTHVYSASLEAGLWAGQAGSFLVWGSIQTRGLLGCSCLSWG